MRFILFSCFFISFLFAEYSVAKISYVSGDVYVLRHGKLLKAFTSFKLDSTDVIYSKSYNKVNITFKNGFRYSIDPRVTISIQTIVNTNKTANVKTMKQIKRDREKNPNYKDQESYKYNSKFYKQLFKNRLNQRKEIKTKPYVDAKRDIYVQSDEKNTVNISSDEDSTINVGKVNAGPRSSVRGITIQSKTENVSNMSKGRDNHSNSRMGMINVK